MAGDDAGDVPGAGAVPAGVGGGGAVVERVRDSTEPGCVRGGPTHGCEHSRCRSDHAGSASRNRAASRGGSLDVVGPGDSQRLRRQTESRLLNGNVFTGYLGLDYRLQQNVLLGLAVVHSQGDVDYETRDVTKGDVDITLTIVLPVCTLEPAAGIGGMGVVRRRLGRLGLERRSGQSRN